MSENRIAEVEEAPAPAPAREYKMPDPYINRLNMYTAGVVAAVRSRDGFLDAAKLALGAPDDYVCDLKRGVFVQAQRAQNGNGAEEG